MHEEDINIASVADEEDFVAGGDQVAGLLVGAETDLLFHQLAQIFHFSVRLIPPSRSLISPKVHIAEFEQKRKC